MSTILDLFRGSGALYGGNAAFIEDLYERYLVDPDSIDLAWRVRFEGLRQEAANQPPAPELLVPQREQAGGQEAPVVVAGNDHRDQRPVRRMRVAASHARLIGRGRRKI